MDMVRFSGTSLGDCMKHMNNKGMLNNRESQKICTGSIELFGRMHPLCDLQKAWNVVRVSLW